MMSVNIMGIADKMLPAIPRIRARPHIPHYSKLIIGCDNLKILLSELEYEFDIEQNHPITFDSLTPGRRKPVVWHCAKCKQNWSALVSNRLKGTGCPYCKGRLPIPGKNDLATVFPNIALNWDYARNKKGPSEYLPYSNARVAWICAYQHRWEEKINNRTAHGLGCPFCAGIRPTPGGDLGSVCPWLNNEWDYKLNGDLKPSDVFPKSNKVVNWICNRNHRWKAKIYHRTAGEDCPYCTGKKPIAGETDLQSCRPDISQEWIDEKNGGHTPAEFTQHSHYLAWWKCKNCHEYQAPIYRRTRGCGCPVCDGKKILPEENSLASYAPELALEWDHHNNGDLAPTQVAPHSNTRYHWICKTCGYAWTASPNNRIAGRGCPKCAGLIVDPEINSFAALNPSLINQWDWDRNQPLTPWDVAAYDNRSYQWICKNGHSFSASPANRTKGTACPYCIGKLPVVGVNDFATTHPSVAAEWHPTKNEGLLPSHFLPNSHEEVWWKCSCDHEWKKAIYLRVNGSNCPFCHERIPVVGVNDLLTLHPELAKLWSSPRNKKRPELYFSDSSSSVWWECESGHSFRAPIREMTLRWRCPKCERKRSAPWIK